MIRIRLDAPSFCRDIEIASAADLIEAEGMTWARDGEVDDLPRYVPVGAG